ncbi:MAG TPA: cation:proton antiporter [Pyrinomonadaceae bacterium]|nr:cation:proton antiporter [Pyrinomonadaceae bacterium]
MNETLFPSILAASVVPQFLTETVALIVAGAVIAYICFRLNLVPIVGFLVAGVLIGPNAFGLVKDQALVDATAEIGVILLLFTIGIEFSLEKLARIQKLIFGGGTMQVGLSILATTLLLLAFGLDWRFGVFTGMLVALSSTAIVLKLLADNHETNSEQGQVGLGLLIFQDLAIVVMVLLIPVLAPSGSGGGASEIAFALLKAAAIIAVVLVVARRIMPKILELVAKTCSPELFLLTVIAICFGTAYLTNLAGVSLSLGAFLAGLMVSESRFSQHALSETLPLQILFSATFFVSVGMLLDVSFLVQNLGIIAAAIAVVLVIKVVTTWISVRALGYSTPIAAASALMLAQIGEFSFVLERAGREVGLFPVGSSTNGSQTFIAATVVLMVATPFLMRIGSGLSAKIVRKQETAGMPDDDGESLGEALALEDHVIVAGYGEAARCLVRVLAGSGIPYIITTLSPDGANEADSEGLPVIRGDATKPFLLRHVGVDNAKMMVIADDNPAMAHRITSVARQINPTMRIVVRTRYTEEVQELAAAGADTVIAEELESVVQLFGEVLRDYKIPASDIEMYEEIARSNGYAELFRDQVEIDNSVFRCETGADCFDSRTVKIREGAPIVGRPASALMLLDDFGLHLKSLRRNGEEIDPVPSDLVFAPGDEIDLSGPTQAFANNAAMFRPVSTNGTSVPLRSAASDETAMAFATETGIDMETEIRYKPTVGPEVCSHLDRIRPVFPSAPGCEECLRIGDDWVHLRLCLVCGHVGCCDTSKNKHGTAHFNETNHPVMKSIEKDEDWAWCFVDEDYI